MATEATGLQWAIAIAPGWIGLLAATAAATLLLAVRATRGLPAGRRALLVTLRALVALGLLLAVLQPTWVSLRPRDDERTIAIVVDVSRSMAVGDKRPRVEAAAEAVQSLGARGQLRVFAAGGQLELERLEAVAAMRPSDWRALATGESTDLLGALGRLQAIERAAGLGSVVLLSDGRDHGALAATDDDALRGLLVGLGVPVHAVAFGADEALADVALVDVRVSRHALVRNPLPLEVEMALGAYAGREGALTLQLELDGVQVATQALPLAGEARRRVRLEVVPPTTGPHVVSVRALALPGEVTVANNALHVPIEVVRDRARVLHLAGHPSWDTRFLRSHLRADPTVDLVSFYIMVGRDGASVHAAEETTLIPFPSRQLFGEALDDFDLVVFQDFAFHHFDIDRMVPTRLGPWIERGGGLLVLGGRQSLSAGGWQETSILPWLPLQLGASEDAYRDEEEALRLTDLGERHPVTRLRREATDNGAAWRAASLPGTHSGQIARSGDGVLVERADGTPLLALGERGEGRVAALASGGLWTWAFAADGERSRSDARDDYRALLQRLRGWLLRDVAFERLRLLPPRAAADPGRDIDIGVQLLGADLRPVADATVQATDQPLPIAAGDVRRAKAARCRTDAEGRCQLRLLSWPPGPHLLQANAEGGAAVASVAWAVSEGPAEDRDLRADVAALRRIAAASGGKVATDASALETSALLGSEQRDAERVRLALWAHPLVLVALLVLLGLEWALRRRWGLR